MPVLLSSPEPRVGKTSVVLALGRLAGDRGERAGYVKPIGRSGQRLDGEPDGDAVLARRVLELGVEARDLEPVVYSPAFVQSALRGEEDSETLRELVTRRVTRVAGSNDRTFVEGSGSRSTGACVGLTDADVAELVDATVVLVARYDEPGDVDPVVDAADRFGDRFGGVLFNAVSDAAFDGLASDAVPFLEDHGVRVFGTVPSTPELAGVVVADLASDLDAEVLPVSSPRDAVVERVVAGSMSAHDAAAQLRGVRNAALVVDGDRIDLQEAVLDEPSVACLVLTGGTEPPEEIVARARAVGVPMLVVQPDVVSALDHATAAVGTSRIRSSEAVEAMADRLVDYADVEAMLDP